jgi:phage virion morphogenesis protein
MGAILKYDMRGLDAVQKRINRLAKTHWPGLLDVVGATVESQTRRRIQDDKESPKGVAWPAWSEDYSAKRPEGRTLLMNEDHLLDSITFIRDGSKGVKVGSNMIYAATHQFGDEDRNIPARAYLGVSADNENDLIDAIDEYLDEVING